MFEESFSLWASMNSWFTPTVLFVFLNIMIGTIAITSRKSHEHQHHNHNHNHPIARSPSVLQRLRSINFYGYRSPEPTSLFAQNPSHYTHQEEYQHQQQLQQSPDQFTRSPSVLHRLKSINLYNYFSHESSATPLKTQEPDTHYIHPQEELQKEAKTEQDEVVEEEEEEGQSMDEIYDQLKQKNVNTKPTSGEIPFKLPRKMKKSASSKSSSSHFEEADIIEARRPATVKESRTTTPEVGDDEVDAKADHFIYKFKEQLKLQRIDSIIRNKETLRRRN